MRAARLNSDKPVLDEPNDRHRTITIGLDRQESLAIAADSVTRCWPGGYAEGRVVEEWLGRTLPKTGQWSRRSPASAYCLP